MLKFHVITTAFLLFFIFVFYKPLPSLACSSRSLPKPRPSSIAAPTSTSTTPRTTTTTTSTTTTTTTPRPNITFPTFKCPANYDAWYCLNEATCFTVKIGESIMYNCECAMGFMGPRCEYKELDGSYEPKRPRPILEKASIASGATCVLLFVLFVCLTLYMRYEQKSAKRMNDKQYYVVNSNSSSRTNITGKCSFCTAQNCCSYSMQEFNDAKFLMTSDKITKGVAGIGGGRSMGGDGGGTWLRHHIEAFPMSFTVKRFNKI